MALEREAISIGLKESIEIIKGATGQTSADIMTILMLTQYLDTLKSIGLDQNNSKVIFLDSSISKKSKLMQQLMAFMEGGIAKKTSTK
jgi:hypothetical protein